VSASRNQSKLETMNFRSNQSHVGFAAALVGSLALASGGCSAQAQDGDWQPASQVLSDDIIAELVSSETNTPEAEVDALIEGMMAWVIPGDEGELVLVDYRSDLLCGAAGCLHGGLWLDDGELQGEGVVFSAHLRRELPPEMSLIQPVDVNDGVSRPLPCLSINQLEGTQLIERTVCMEEGSYDLVDSRSLPVEG
jgi:hypothetical protein